MTGLYIKALHLIFVVTWFAGLFYLGRLFIYFKEASQKPEPDKQILSDQLRLMTSRLLWIICVPSMVLTIAMGTTLIALKPAIFTGWLHMKLTLVLLLIVYQLYCIRLFREMKTGEIGWSDMKLRLWNEVATLFLFSIVFLAVLKSALDTVYGLVGLIGLAILLMMGIRIYKKSRG